MSCLKNARVFIVENDDFNVQHLRRELTALNYEVCGVYSTGEEAVAQVAQLKPDLILMDIGLDGEMDGIDTAAAIAALRPTPVVYLSGTTDEPTLMRARKPDRTVIW